MTKTTEKKRVLLVEDEPDLRATLSWFLENQGFQVAMAENGDKALELARHEGFDVVLSDYRMPGMDGVNTLRALKELDPELPVIIISGFLSNEKRETCLKEGAFEFLSKPFGVKQVVEVVHRALNSRKSPDDEPGLRRKSPAQAQTHSQSQDAKRRLGDEG